MKRSLVRAGLSVLAVLFCYAPAARPRAASITLYLAGRVQGVDDPYSLLDGSIVPGGLVTGSYTFDAVPPGNPPNGKVAAYPSGSPGSGIRLKLGSYVFQSASGHPQLTISVAHAFNGDRYTVYSYANDPLSSRLLVRSIGFSLVDPTQTALGASSLSAGAPDLARWRQYDLPTIVGSEPGAAPSKDPDAQDLEARREFKIGIIIDAITPTLQPPPAHPSRPLHASGLQQGGAVDLMAGRPTFAPGTLVPQGGDIDGDGAVTVEDALWAMRFAVGLVPPTAAQGDAADVDGDGRIDIRDAGILLRMAVGLPIPA